METRVAAYGVIVREGQVLLSHWLEGERWTLPGGGLEFGEAPTDAAGREILEETGYSASVGALLGIDSFVIPGHERIHGEGIPLHSIQVVYEARVVSGELTDEIGGSSDRAQWFDLGEVAELPRVRHVDFGLAAWRARAERA